MGGIDALSRTAARQWTAEPALGAAGGRLWIEGLKFNESKNGAVRL